MNLASIAVGNFSHAFAIWWHVWFPCTFT